MPSYINLENIDVIFAEITVFAYCMIILISITIHLVLAYILLTIYRHFPFRIVQLHFSGNNFSHIHIHRGVCTVYSF